VQAIATVERLFVVRAGSFTPPPKVDSAVVRISPLAETLVRREEQRRFRAFVTGIFSQRRKQISRGLRGLLKLEKAAVDRFLLMSDIDPSARAEVLTVDQLVGLFRGTKSLTHQRSSR
jgi:16S rRNA (adenine1518-N6/adenine1519-N6)-dimethyltransferase